MPPPPARYESTLLPPGETTGGGSSPKLRKNPPSSVGEPALLPPNPLVCNERKGGTAPGLLLPPLPAFEKFAVELFWSSLRMLLRRLLVERGKEPDVGVVLAMTGDELES